MGMGKKRRDIKVRSKLGKSKERIRSKKTKRANTDKVGGDLLKALDEKLAIIVKAAAGRAKANGRKTVSARDL